ncbi:hypothetical protein GCM10008018_47160 [Paenibacillus marchantiophytorum]|uniref:PAS domain S-box protein n=1 Tax=Paenibacillus marchantiophytorum TaxID=1619310 RepID=A0ABQ1F004_9BACL|nr:MHYT domain-containing protein [Paenibacillus marchantiophytorum]GFZ95371.1 hypothetical protein GCM10008018_47160 [Paenibacillus marchantiophytorum]
MQHLNTHTYNLAFSILSFILVLIASLTCLNLTRKVASSTAWYQKLWIASSALSLGIGIWAMHFIALLAYPFPAGLTYDIQTVLISVSIAVLGALIGFFVMYRSKLVIPKLIVGGTFMGLSLSGMHFIGLGALNDIEIRYSPFPFILSIVLSVGVSIIVLYLSAVQNQTFIFSGLVMSFLLMCVHYVGMLAANITYSEELPSHMHSVYVDKFVLAVIVAFGTVILLFISLLSSLKTDQKLLEQMALQASILTCSMDCILMFNSRGWIIEFNPAAEAAFGYSRKHALGLTMLDFLFPFNQDGKAAASLYGHLARQDDSLIGKRFEVTAYRADRSEFPAEMTITGFQYEGKTVYTACLRDLSKSEPRTMLQEKVG